MLRAKSSTVPSVEQRLGNDDGIVYSPWTADCEAEGEPSQSLEQCTVELDTAEGLIVLDEERAYRFGS